MLVVFSSPATESLTMFGNHAVELLKQMGATGKVPGGLSAEDVPAALARLQAAVARGREQGETPQQNDRDEESQTREGRNREPPIALATRAIPLIDLLKRVVAAKAALVWEARN